MRLTYSRNLKLFAQTTTDLEGPSNHNDDPFRYYEKSSRKDIRLIRELLNRWFSNYPKEHQRELKASFKKHFDDSFYELFLHQLFRDLGYKVEIHPKLSNSDKRPDFLIKKGNQEIYVEAKITSGKSNKQKAFVRMRDQFYDNLNKIRTSKFYIQIESLEFKTGNQPSTSSLIHSIEEELHKYDPEVLIQEVEKYGFHKLPNFQIENDDIKLNLRFLPKKRSARKEFQRPIGVFPFSTHWGGGEQNLKEAIELKAKKFMNLDKPLLICINSLDEKTTDKMDVDFSIWGSKSLAGKKIFENKQDLISNFEQSIFIKNGNPRLEYLNGILVTQIYPSNIPHARYYLYKNPFSSKTLDFEKIGLEYNAVVYKFNNEKEGQNLDSILGLSKDWLE